MCEDHYRQSRAVSWNHLHDRAAEGVAGGFRIRGSGLGHHAAAERIARRPGGAVLGGLVSRHFEF